GLGGAIPLLLFEISTDGAATMVPDNGAGGESDRLAAIEQSPADIDVVAGLAELGIEAPHRQQRRAAEGHVAAGYVLGEIVIEHDVTGPAGTGGHAARGPAIRGRRN